MAGQIAQLLVIPFLLHALGTERYGLFALFLAIVASGGILDAGVGPTVLRFVARAGRRSLLVEHIVASAITVVLLIGIVIFVLASAAAALFPVILSQNIGGQVSTFSFVLLTTASLVFAMLATVALNAIRGARKYRVFSFGETGLRVLQPLVVTGAAIWSGSITVVLASYCLVTGILAAILLLVMARQTGIELRLATDLRYFRRRMLRFGRWIWVQAICGYAGTQADRFIVLSLTDLHTLGIYSVAASVANGIMGVAGAASGFLVPEAAARIGRKDWLFRTFKRATLLLSGLSSLGILLLMFAAPGLLDLWLGEPRGREVVPFLLPLLWVTASGITSIPATNIANVVGAVRLTATIGIVANLVTLTSMVVGGHLFGPFGVVFGKWISLPMAVVARAIVLRYVFGSTRAFGPALILMAPTLLGAALGLAWIGAFLNF